MKERLEQLTTDEFIELASGNTKVLLSRHEIVSTSKLSDVSRDIIFEYKQISDHSGAEAFLRKLEQTMRCDAEIAMLSILSNLLKLRQYNYVREALGKINVRAHKMSDVRLEAEVKSRLRRAKRNKEETDSEEINQTEVRDVFDEQTAALMAHYKFQIDTSTMKATLYAHLVSRFNREIKNQMEALKKKRTFL